MPVGAVTWLTWITRVRRVINFWIRSRLPAAPSGSGSKSRTTTPRTLAWLYQGKDPPG